MNEDIGTSASQTALGSAAGHPGQTSCPGPSGAIASAHELVSLLVDYNSITAAEFHARYPFYLPDIERLKAAGWDVRDAPLRVIIGYAKRLTCEDA